MRRLLISTTALSVAISPLGTLPVYSQTVAEDGSVIGPDGTVLCIPTIDAPCDMDAIMAALAAADAAAAEAAAQAEADAAAQAEAEAAAQAAADAAQAEADAAAQAEADAAAQAEADAAAQAEADAAAQAAADAAAQAEADAAAQAAADAAAQAEAEAAAAAAAEAQVAAQAEADAAAQAAADAEAASAAAALAAEEAAASGDAEAEAAAAALAEEQAAAAAAAQAEADATAQANAAAAAESEAAAQAEAEGAAQAAADAEAAAAAAALAAEEAAAAGDAEAAAAAAALAEEEAAAAAAAQAEADAAAQVQADAEAAAAAAAEAAAATDVTEAVVEPLDAPADGVFDTATGEMIDPAVAAEAVAEAEQELAITDEGTLVDPAAGLKVAEPDPIADAIPVDVPVVTETEVEGLNQLLMADPTAVDFAATEAAAEIPAEPASDGTFVLPEADPAALVGTLTETMTADNVRTSAEEFAAPPVELKDGKKNKLSNLEKAGLVVLGALVIGAIIKSNNERREEESRVVSNTGDRVIILRPDGTYEVLKDDDSIIRTPGSTVTTETFRDGSTRTIVKRTDGTQVVTIRDATGRVLRRATYDRNGRELILIDDLADEDVVIIHDLPKPKKKIVISSMDDDTALKRELARLEAEKAGRKFSLRQIREIPEVRALAATIDVEPITFASGSAAVTAEEARNLADLGRTMQDLLDENPGEIFLIMGHTDATGKTAMNLALSDRRAESVALALTEYFDIPPENMVIQGYGETELLIDTQEDEPLNRRVEVKVITPLMRTAELQ